QFQTPAFGTVTLPQRGVALGITPGITVADAWWVNGRQRSLVALTGVDADPTSMKLPSPSGPVAMVLAACGKAKSTVQAPLVEGPPARAASVPDPNPEVAATLTAIVRDYRAALGEAVDRAALPHDLPPAAEARTTTALGQTAGPKKPTLVRAFQPMGYDCKG